MKAPISWLRELANLPKGAGTKEIADSFTRLGLTVEHIELTGSQVTGSLVIGRVLSFAEGPQKNGKTIQYCRVDVGSHSDPADEQHPASRGIVCGTSDFVVDDLMVVALPGAVLPGDFRISARKAYGHVPDGMICAGDEIGLGKDHAGIIVIPGSSGLHPGDGALAALRILDEVLDIDVTPNLSRGLSLWGLDRELAVVNGVPLSDPYDLPLLTPVPDGYPVVLELDRCSAFIIFTIEGFDPAAPIPRFMADRLCACGVYSISLPVDVTNYVMLESGQPLHAYDAAKLQGSIRVRLATEGEKITTLDGVRRTFTADDLSITDDSSPIGIAGAIGGETIEVSAETTAIVLEAATLAPASASHTFQRHGLPLEASKRFERTADPGLTYATARRAADLLVEHGGDQVRGDVTVVGQVPVPARIDLRAGLVFAILGAEAELEKILRVPEAGGCRVMALGDSLTIEAPTWCPDLRDPYDIVEEVGRKVGYHRIGSHLPAAPTGRGLMRAQRARRAAMHAATASGFTEILSLPFASEVDLDRMGLVAGDPRRAVMRLANPLAETSPYLRTTLLPGLFVAVARNTSRPLTDLTIFEHGLVYIDGSTPAAPRPGVEERPGDEEIATLQSALPEQPGLPAGVVTGAWRPAGWDTPAVAVDWRHVVALAEAVVRITGHTFECRGAEVAPWHPGRCVELLLAGRTVGYAGELHSEVIRALGSPARTCAMELDLGTLLGTEAEIPHTGLLSGFPLAKGDVALIVDEDAPTESVRKALAEGAGELLESIGLFDVYHGDQVSEGRKSLTFGLRFRADRTLTGAEAAAARDAAVAVVTKRFGATQRS